jgi:hypothetical protein
MTIRGNKLLGGISAQRGANDNAIWYFDKVITMASDDYEGNNARFDKFFVTLNGKKDIPAATRILNEIKSLDFTDKELVNRIGIAERMLTNGKAVTKNLSKSTNTNTTRAPMEYALYQNFPNPFNPYTTINYQIKFDGLVSLKIYDMLGREVKTLVNEEQTAGKYSIIFDGSTLASGVYFYTLRSGEYSTTKKLLLIK